jgi:hypothetical protein
MTLYNITAHAIAKGVPGFDAVLVRAMDPQVFFDEFAKPNYDEFKSSPADRRKAFNACLTAWHLLDHMVGYYKDKDPALVDGGIDKYRERLFVACVALRDIEAVAVAFKHLKVNHKRPKKVLVSAGNVTGGKRRFPLNVINKSPEFGTVLESTLEVSAVFIDRADGTTVRLEPLLDSVMEMWVKELERVAQSPKPTD